MNPDELQTEMEELSDYLEALQLRLEQQAVDIKRARNELQKFEFDEAGDVASEETGKEVA